MRPRNIDEVENEVPATLTAEAFTAVWTAISDAHWDHNGDFVHGNRAVSEWTFTGANSDGKRVEAQGVDLFTLRDGRIVVKPASRKHGPLQ